MCYFCEERLADYDAYRCRLAELRGAVTSTASFLAKAQEADALRFESGAEWSQTELLVQAADRVFRNPDPEHGLLLFVLTCWLDMQMPYVMVWSECLRQTDEWLESWAWESPEIGLPSTRFPRQTHRHLLRSVRTLSGTPHGRSLVAWMSRSILGIVRTYGSRPGNLYRFVGRVCRGLYHASDQSFTEYMSDGELPVHYAGSHYKRLWMLMMFLRRDRSVVRCLVSRALAGTPNGEEALGYWTDDAYFAPEECELPVDGRVLDGWNGLGLWDRRLTRPEEVAMQARRLARENSLSPASFDAMLFVTEGVESGCA